MSRRRRRAPGDPTVAVAYLRVSTEEQALGPAAQRGQIERWAAAQGIRIASWHEDAGLSGGLDVAARPGLLGALEAIVRLGAGVLVAAKRDRIARDVLVAGAVERMVSDAGARLLTADGASAATGPEGILFRGMGDLLAQYERELIRARTRAALAVKKTRGERVGSLPFGSQLAADGVRLEPNAGERAVIDLIASLREAGETYRGIVDTLNERAVPARGERWHLRSVQRILAAVEAVA